MKVNDVNISQANKELVQWSGRYEMGIPELDAQHKGLIDLCNSLYDEILVSDRNNQKTVLIKSLKDCVEYVTQHFTLEEYLMKEAGFADLANHKARHNEFTNMVLKTAKDIESKTGALDGLKFVKFLHDWILQHVSYEDRLFVPVVKEYLSKK